MAEFLLVTSIFAVVCLHALIGLFVTAALGAVGILAGIILKACIEIASRLRMSSERISDLNLRKGFAKIDQKFFQSCRPFQIKIGSTFTLKRDSFLLIMGEVVIATVINLLVTL
jgi:hypothetical protein